MVFQIGLLTVQDLEAYEQRIQPDDRHFELIHGEIIEKTMPTELHALIITKLLVLLSIAIQQAGHGRVGPEIRIQVPSDPHNVRLPDIAYFADSSRPIVERGAVPLMPDLAIEVKSPDDTYAALRTKADYYLTNGSQVVWLVFPESQQIEIRRSNAHDILGITDTLQEPNLLPGFSAPLAEIFKL
jgi:Uma2 family endonuclease